MWVCPIIKYMPFSFFQKSLSWITKQQTNILSAAFVLMATAIFSQLRLVDTKRFIRKVDVINEAIFEEIKKAIRKLFQ